MSQNKPEIRNLTKKLRKHNSNAKNYIASEKKILIDLLHAISESQLKFQIQKVTFPFNGA